MYYVYICIFICMYVYMYIYIYTHTHMTFIHAHIHMQTYAHNKYMNIHTHPSLALLLLLQRKLLFLGSRNFRSQRTQCNVFSRTSEHLWYSPRELQCHNLGVVYVRSRGPVNGVVPVMGKFFAHPCMVAGHVVRWYGMRKVLTLV